MLRYNLSFRDDGNPCTSTGPLPFITGCEGGGVLNVQNAPCTAMAARGRKLGGVVRGGSGGGEVAVTSFT
eukprot:755802-Hanusia_phi.AAC.3